LLKGQKSRLLRGSKKNMVDFDWRPYGLLPQAVNNGVIDGFFVPHDWGVSPPRMWPGGKVLICVSTPKGRHLVAAGIWQNYGYPNLRAFTVALREGSAMCKTAAGMVCLGPSRFVPGAEIVCEVAGIIAGRRMELIAGNQADLGLLRAFLHEHFPGALVSSRSAGLSGQIAASGVFNFPDMLRAFAGLASEQRLDIALVSVAGLVSIVGSILAICGFVWPWLAVMAIVGFAGAASLAMFRASIRDSSASREQEKGRSV
jgi:hypothetical protein